GTTLPSATPTMHNSRLQYHKSESIPKIRFVSSCSSPLQLALYNNLERTLCTPVFESYGMTRESAATHCHLCSGNQGLLDGFRAPWSFASSEMAKNC
ncbi:hypothetical protein FB567DRAFT_455788, partial [Paraphoma chrysanthemicola]